MWATRILPFADPVSFPAYMDRETAVYEQAACNQLNFWQKPGAGRLV